MFGAQAPLQIGPPGSDPHPRPLVSSALWVRILAQCENFRKPGQFSDKDANVHPTVMGTW